MTGSRDGIWGWRLVKLVTVLVYLFMFAPIIVTIILSFNASMFGGFPMTGVSLQWLRQASSQRFGAACLQDLGVDRRHHRHSLHRAWRHGGDRPHPLRVPRQEWVNTLVIMPALVPETILGVGLLLLIKWLHMPRTYLLLLLGHIMLALPFVVLVVQAASSASSASMRRRLSRSAPTA